MYMKVLQILYNSQHLVLQYFGYCACP